MIKWDSLIIEEQKTISLDKQVEEFSRQFIQQQNRTDFFEKYIKKHVDESDRVRFQHEVLKRFPDLKVKPKEFKNHEINLFFNYMHENYHNYFHDVLTGDLCYLNGESHRIDTDILISDLLMNDIRISKQFIYSLKKNKTITPQINNIEEYLKGLPKWQPTNTNYIDKMFSIWKLRPNNTIDKYDEFIKKQVEKWLVRCIHQGIGEPIMKLMNKQGLILISPSSSGKSSWVRDQFLPDAMKDFMYSYFIFNDKVIGSLKSMHTKWFIFIDEFDGFANQESNVSKMGINMFKRFTGETNIQYKEKGITIDLPRRGNFILTINEKPFIYDETLLTRFIPVHISNYANDRIRFKDWENEDAEGLFAQCYYYYLLSLEGKYDFQQTQEEGEIVTNINHAYFGKMTLPNWMRLNAKPSTKIFSATQLCHQMLSRPDFPTHLKAQVNEVFVGMVLKSILNFSKQYTKDLTHKRGYPLTFFDR